MGDRYHYDKNDNYKGKTSSTPPGDNSGWGCVILIIFFLILGNCSGCRF
jgi:hypothetical protein